jgi:hypothetical protein
MQRVQMETDPGQLLSALEEVMRRAAAPTTPAATATEATPALDDLAALIAAAEKAQRRPPMVTISNAALRSAPPIVQKQPSEMSLDELNDWAIAEAIRRRGAPAAG